MTAILKQIPTNYKVQDGCWNCRFAFVLFLYQSTEYYCHQDGSDRPRHGEEGEKHPPRPMRRDSRLEGEDLEREVKAARAQWRLEYCEPWNQWAMRHRVAKCGICSKHERMKTE